MASELALSTAGSGEIDVGREMRESFSMLDVLYANQFKGESLDPEIVEQTEETFYRGAPPEWLNFHISEQAESDGTGTSFIKRDGYNTLKQQIQNKRKLQGISTVKLFHQPGCGGTTLAMQVLWDLRKSFRCAVLTVTSLTTTSEATKVATEVVHLFTAGSRGYQNTVLLLLNDEHILENLQKSIMEKIDEQKIVTYMPVVIFLCCVRKDEVLQRDYVILQKALSDTEKQKFDEKKKELSRKYRDKCEQFHGFNIMQTTFSEEYVKQACTVFGTVQRANKPLKTQLATFLSLLNAYVPGSYLLESQCLDFVKQEDSIHGHLSLEDRMKPFSHLIITFQHNGRSGRKVCMAHPMIAKRCTELMGEAGVSRSDTARSFLTCLCRDKIPSCLLGFVKDMLTKREKKTEENPKKRINGDENDKKYVTNPKRNLTVTTAPPAHSKVEKFEMFSGLILDIQRKECKVKGASVLEKASCILLKEPSFPQTLARFYYIELKDYDQAERWAKEAKKRDPKNSFVADTLGQVFKNHLNNKEFSFTPREILQLATKAIDAFKDEEQLAENEDSTEMREDGNTKVSNIFNTRGQVGYLQVCNIVYDQLVAQNETWKKVLTKNVSMDSVLESLGDKELYSFNGLISSLRDEVEKKCNFLNAYLTFSKPGIQKDDPPYIQSDVSLCYCKYTEHELPDLIKDVMNTFEDTAEENMSPSDANSPEPHIVALLKEWPKDDSNSSDLMLFTEKINRSYDCAYAKYFRTRYLRPLFYLYKDEALKRIAPKNQQEKLIFHGVVKNYRLFATIGGTEIMVNADTRDSLWIPREVSFYLGFNIRGLVAFGIQTKNTKQGPSGQMKLGACGGVMDLSDWTKLKPEVTRVDDVQTYSLRSEAGHYECNVSALRWVCKKKVSFKYQFNTWEKHMRSPSCKNHIPAGPLLDITVTAGKLEEVHLPHWIFIDQNSATLDMFAVLHIDTCGEFLQKVSEVTMSHVKLLQPTFSPIGAMIRKKLRIPVHYDVLIYKTNKEFLTLDVYLIPPDPALQQTVEKKQEKCKSVMIQKPSPDTYLQIGDKYLLTTDEKNAKIQPTTQEFRYDSRNVFEVLIRNADSDFTLRLESEKETEQKIVWTCDIHKGDYKSQRTDLEQDQHFVDRHRTALINRVTDTGAILDKLMDTGLISNEKYDGLRKKNTYEQMRDILGIVSSAGRTAQDTLYDILKGMKHLRPLISELEGSG